MVDSIYQDNRAEETPSPSPLPGTNSSVPACSYESYEQWMDSLMALAGTLLNLWIIIMRFNQELLILLQL